MAKSKNINLNLTPETEIEQTLFDDWRQSIDGYNGENPENPSNFEIIDDKIGDIYERISHLSSLRFEVVTTLPRPGDPNIIYLKHPNTGGTDLNYYEEFIYVESKADYELIGSTRITFDDVPTENSPNAVKSGGVYTALQGKVDKEQGKGLSTNDFTNSYKTQVEENTLAKHSHSNKSILDNITASYTSEEQTKLSNIESGAQVNVQADWEEEDPNSDAYIANKPTVPAAQVNADWNADSGVSEILNKPDLSIYAEEEDLSDVAFSGSYKDLIDKPIIPSGQIQSDWEEEDPDSVSYIQNKPDIEDMIAEEQSRAIAVETELETKIESKSTVLGENDGANWTSLTIGDDTYAIPQGSAYTAGEGITIENNIISTTVDANKIVAQEQARAIATETELANRINNKQDQLTAGENITIENGIISASGSSSELDITSEELSQIIAEESENTYGTYVEEYDDGVIINLGNADINNGIGEFDEETSPATYNHFTNNVDL